LLLSRVGLYTNPVSSFTHNIGPDHLVHIGDMTVSFAHLELQMKMILFVLVNQPARIGSILASYLSFRMLRDAIRSLYLERFGEDPLYPELKELLAEAETLEGERNRITHSLWMATDNPEALVQHKVTARGQHGLNVEFKEYPKEKLAGFVQDIQKLTGGFVDFYNKLPSIVSR
jgi:hypothetical protein